MRIGMSFYPQAVVLEGRVYVGGGSATSTNDSTIVMYYDIERDQWTALPQYNYMYYAMTVVKEEFLVLVGGRHPTMTTKTTRKITAWDETAQRWEHNIIMFTDMPVARDASTTVVYDDKYLIVAGGRDDAYQVLSRIDILDLHSHQWYSGASLPQVASKMSAVVIGGTLVLHDGARCDRFSNKVFSVQLDDLILQATSHKGVSSSPWQSLTDIPVESSTIVAFKGALLAVGGSKPTDSNATCIHLFKPSTRTWIEAGHLPTNRLRCACTVLPSGEIFVAGGALRLGAGKESEVHIAVLQ